MNTTHYIHPNGKTTTPSNANITHIISGHPNINDYSARRLVGLGKNRPTKPQHIAKLLKFTTWQHRIKTGDEPKLYARMTAYPNNCTTEAPPEGCHVHADHTRRNAPQSRHCERHPDVLEVPLTMLKKLLYSTKTTTPYPFEVIVVEDVGNPPI